MHERIIVRYVKEMESEELENGQVVGLSVFTPSVCKANLQSKKLASFSILNNDGRNHRGLIILHSIPIGQF
jgi:hypothetical protein